MIKYKIIFLLAFVLVVCGNVFSQTKEISFDSIEKKPYEFLVNQTKFRIRFYDTSSDNETPFVLEKYNTTWNPADSFEYHRAIYFRDINYDGFIDFALSDKWESETYLFNPIKNSYVESGFYSDAEFDDDLRTDAPHLQLIDKDEQIYFDYLTDKNCVWHSILFQIKNYKRIELGTINNETIYSEKDDDFITTAIIIINRILNDEKTDKILFEKIKRDKKDNDFDYATYWKNNWRKFLPQQN